MYHDGMAKTIKDMLAKLAHGDLGSPQVVADIDAAIAALETLRKAAVSIHGNSESEPVAHLKMPPTKGIAKNGLPETKNNNQDFDGLIKSLIALYRADQAYLALRYKTRKTYDVLTKFIEADCGDENVAHWKMQNIQRLYDGWVNKRSKSMARSLIVMLRTLISFGANILHDNDCERLTIVLHRMRFPVLKSRTERLSLIQANGVREEARRMDRASIALAQAFQFDCKLRQTDVVGEWVPENEPGECYGVRDAGIKWLRGIRWEEIDSNLILTHKMSKNQAETIVDLKKQAPMVIEELELKFRTLDRNEMPPTGPVIVCEITDLPWHAAEFRRYWRKAADKAGIPRSIRNADSSAGATREESKARANSSAADVDLTLELKGATPH